MTNRAILWYTCAALAVCLTGTSVAGAQPSVPGIIVEKKGGVIVPPSRAPREQPQQAAAVADSSSGANLDVVGIKPGMTVKDAMLALKADNPRLTLLPSTLQIEGFKDQLMTSVTGRESPTVERSGEDVTIAFTVIPTQEAVWGVRRVLYFANSERPSLQATLDALHKKYGLETTPPDPDPRMSTKGIVWVYDAAHERPMGPGGKQAFVACAQLFTNIEGSLSVQNDITSGASWLGACGSVSIVTASVQAGQDAASGQFVVNNLTLSLADGARYRAALEATRAVVLNAAKAREKTQTEEVNKRAAPKL
jgi:hypothetical protein